MKPEFIIVYSVSLCSSCNYFLTSQIKVLIYRLFIPFLIRAFKAITVFLRTNWEGENKLLFKYFPSLLISENVEMQFGVDTHRHQKPHLKVRWQTHDAEFVERQQGLSPNFLIHPSHPVRGVSQPEGEKEEKTEGRKERNQPASFPQMFACSRTQRGEEEMPSIKIRVLDDYIQLDASMAALRL